MKLTLFYQFYKDHMTLNEFGMDIEKTHSEAMLTMDSTVLRIAG